ncbi:LysM peptidoglycan-binding domain-containing protein [Desertibacillus haloalkaliphilus]|uniref:LysM peptidoglycan-binding domain-containing protein n=1 Tax=Desertibacillus haloalkaliphilus TaxID=1328930 RepID=UPI001C27AC8C|nr:LysM peptidoglycan-binding domain-containing protein [Desertibacillus haloalkaliphilus]MBU8906381.1 LysM peptidoglycan-binding domain-containing protein [Desertibacillus haloalkaliphilus]
MKTHHCKHGETLYVLAEKYDIDVNLLLNYNQHIHDPASILEGTQVIIPSMSGHKGLHKHHSVTKGNVCAYVSDEPIKYKKLTNVLWPSQDYAVGYGSHTTLTPYDQSIHLPYRSAQQQQLQTSYQQMNFYPQYYYPNGYYY